MEEKALCYKSGDLDTSQGFFLCNTVQGAQSI